MEKVVSLKDMKSPEEVAFHKPLHVLFVCSGNTCRSPMAAAVLNDLSRIPPICSMCDLEKILNARPIFASSAGLAANDGDPITANAAEALENAGIRSLPDNDYKNHTARSVSADLMHAADRVVAISGSHAMKLFTLYPECASKITAMPRDIPDPFGGDLGEYEVCLEAIREGVEALFFPENAHES